MVQVSWPQLSNTSSTRHVNVDNSPVVGRWQQIRINIRRVYFARRQVLPAMTGGRGGRPVTPGAAASDRQQSESPDHGLCRVVCCSSSRQIDSGPLAALRSTYLLSAWASGFASRWPTVIARLRRHWLSANKCLCRIYTVSQKTWTIFHLSITLVNTVRFSLFLHFADRN